MNDPALEAQRSQVTDLMSGSIMFIMLAVLAVVVVAMWKLFTKAGKPGWAAIVPIYNIYVLQEIVGRPGWWALLYFIPFVSFVIAIINAFDLAKVFGKGGVFAFLGLLIFPVIGYPMLAFGKANYNGSGAPATPAV